MFTIPGKIPITIHWVFFLVAGLIGYLMTGGIAEGLLVMLVIFFSILVHEFGHALTAMGFGQDVRISFQTLGGMTYRDGPRLKLWQEFIVVLNGPMFGFALLIVSALTRSYIGESGGPAVTLMLHASIYINLVWTLLNLLPVGPLDGGRLLGIILEALFGVRGMKINFLIGVVIGAGIAVLSFAYQQYILAFLFIMLATESFRAWRATSTMTEKDQDPELQERFHEAELAYQQGEIHEACHSFREIRKAATAGILYTAATEYLSRALADQGEFEEAYELLLPLENELHVDSQRLLQRLAYHARDADVVLRVGQRSFELQPLHDVAFLNALGHALNNNVRACVGWLKTARREGMPKFRDALDRREFDDIRDDAIFQELISSSDEADH